MRITPATLCVFLFLGACERRTDRDTGAEIGRSHDDTSSVTTQPVDTPDAGPDWVPASPSLPAGARAVVLQGDPTKPGPFRMKLELPDGYEVPPHYHPMSEHVRVAEGNLWVALGKDWDDKKLNPLAKGDTVSVAAKQPHYLRATLRTVIEVSSTGPFEITYVHPEDDPRKTLAE